MIPILSGLDDVVLDAAAVVVDDDDAAAAEDELLLDPPHAATHRPHRAITGTSAIRSSVHRFLTFLSTLVTSSATLSFEHLRSPSSARSLRPPSP
jgi:hypothetical protein